MRAGQMTWENATTPGARPFLAQQPQPSRHSRREQPPETWGQWQQQKPQNHLLLSMRRGRLSVPEMNLKPKWSFVEEKGSVSGTALELPFQMCTLLTTRRNQWRAEAGGEKRRFRRTSERFADLKGNSSAQGVNREGGHCPAPALGT